MSEYTFDRDPDFDGVMGDEIPLEALGERPSLPTYRQRAIGDFAGIMALDGFYDTDALSMMEEYMHEKKNGHPND